MNRIAFIIPYFGKFNNYFPLFLESCAANRDFCDWLIFTDDRTVYAYPENVKVQYLSWDDMKDMIRSKIVCPIDIEQPYKLCDYKPAYGYLFEEYLTGYEYWGHCDTDLIWGRLSDFLSESILGRYDKIFDLGHCTLYRNTKKINTLFMLPLKGRQRYREVYGSKKNFSFDEEYNDSVNNICLEHGIALFQGSFAANTYTKSSNFLLTRLNSDLVTYDIEKKSESVFIWDHGELIRYIMKKGNLDIEKYMYIHFQSRPMKIKINLPLVGKQFKMIPNAFEYVEVDEINKESFGKIKKKNLNLHYFRLRFKNLCIKIKRRMDK